MIHWRWFGFVQRKQTARVTRVQPRGAYFAEEKLVCRNTRYLVTADRMDAERMLSVPGNEIRSLIYAFVLCLCCSYQTTVSIHSGTLMAVCLTTQLWDLACHSYDSVRRVYCKVWRVLQSALYSNYTKRYNLGRVWRFPNKSLAYTNN